MLFIINCRHKAREGGQIALVLGGRPEAGFHDGCILDNQRFRHGGFPLEHDRSVPKCCREPSDGGAYPPDAEPSARLTTRGDSQDFHPTHEDTC